MAGTTPEHSKWVTFSKYARTYNSFAEGYAALTNDESITVYDLTKLRNPFDTVWPLQKQIFEGVYADTLILSGLLAEFDTGVSSSISAIQDLLVANLRKVMHEPPKREIDVQNAIESLLIGRGYQKGVDYDREAGKFKFSGKEFIPDFDFPKISTALEVKLIREHSGISACIEELSADITAYRSRYSHVIICVYDLGVIRDVTEFQTGIESQDGVRICIIKQ